jgi:hypothetical protein
MKKLKVRGDFNGIWSDERGVMLCLSHEDTCKDEFENEVVLKEGLELTAFDEDSDENGDRDDLIAGGIVERPPDWLQNHGSKWVLRIDENGVYHESEMKNQ